MLKIHGEYSLAEFRSNKPTQYDYYKFMKWHVDRIPKVLRDTFLRVQRLT